MLGFRRVLLVHCKVFVGHLGNLDLGLALAFLLRVSFSKILNPKPYKPYKP